MDALTRYRAARLADQVAQQRAAVLAEPGTPATELPCDECGETLDTSTKLQMPDDPVSAAATWVGNAIVFPAGHFEQWDTSGRDYTPLTVTADGRMFGHLAGASCFRDGDMSRCERYPGDPDPRLRNFHTWTTTLDNGETIRTGAITAAANHADVRRMSLEQARAYHENTSTVVARVRAWEDERGRLAVAGSMVPGLPESMMGQVAGAPVSVERYPTRETGGRNTLTAAHLVVTPAWPVLA
jgi:hypothetical protein